VVTSRRELKPLSRYEANVPKRACAVARFRRLRAMHLTYQAILERDLELDQRLTPAYTLTVEESTPHMRTRVALAKPKSP
jgi:hypothetical protein